MGKTTAAAPPPHLSAAMKDWWKSVVRDFDLDPHHLHLLRLACEAWDRAQQAREAIERDGLTVLDRFDQPKAHPMAQVRKEAETSFSHLLRQLDLEGTPDPSQRRHASAYEGR